MTLVLRSCVMYHLRLCGQLSPPEAEGLEEDNIFPSNRVISENARAEPARFRFTIRRSHLSVVPNGSFPHLYSLAYSNYQIIQKPALIIDAENQYYWTITCSIDSGSYSMYKPMFDEITASFTASAPDIPKELGIFVVGVVVVAGIAATALLLALRSSRRGNMGTFSGAPKYQAQAPGAWTFSKCRTANEFGGDYCHNCGARRS